MRITKAAISEAEYNAGNKWAYSNITKVMIEVFVNGNDTLE